MRTRFVIGEDQPDRHARYLPLPTVTYRYLPLPTVTYSSRADVLLVPIAEFVGIGPNGTTGGGGDSLPGASTWTQYAKVVSFLRYAARQAEPMVAKGDDDTFVVPSMLHAHAVALAQARPLPTVAYRYLPLPAVTCAYHAPRARRRAGTARGLARAAPPARRSLRLVLVAARQPLLRRVGAGAARRVVRVEPVVARRTPHAVQRREALQLLPGRRRLHL